MADKDTMNVFLGVGGGFFCDDYYFYPGLFDCGGGRTWSEVA